MSMLINFVDDFTPLFGTADDRRVDLANVGPKRHNLQAVTNCCANCVETSRPQQCGPDLPFLCKPAMRTRWMAGAVSHKSG